MSIRTSLWTMMMMRIVSMNKVNDNVSNSLEDALNKIDYNGKKETNDDIDQEKRNQRIDALINSHTAPAVGSRLN